MTVYGTGSNANASSPVKMKFLFATDSDLRYSRRLYTHSGCWTPRCCFGSPYSSIIYDASPDLIKHASHFSWSVLINAAMLFVLINSSILASAFAFICAWFCSSLICAARALVHLGSNWMILSFGGPMFFLGRPLPRF